MPSVNAVITTSERVLLRQTFFHAIDQIISFTIIWL